MRPMTFEEIQNTAKGILVQFDRICGEHGLRYSIAYGTMIGAVRHGGFIPWDDDVDVVMPREDYEKLMALRYDDGRFEIRSYRYSKGYYYYFSKMIDKKTVLREHYRVEKEMGVFIDIFPMDYYADNKAFEDGHPKRLRELNTLMRNGFLINRQTTPSFVRRLIRYGLRLFALPVRKQLLAKREKQYIMPASGIPSAKTVGYTFSLGAQDKHPKEIWDHLERIPFDDIEVMAFADRVGYLERSYINWKKLPPEEKRVAVHDFDAYWADT